MKYMIRMTDGREYGPADVDVLKQWAQQSRIPQSAMLVPDNGGQPVGVLDVPELAALLKPDDLPSHPPIHPGQGYPLIARHGRRYVFARHARLPDQCLRCGEDVGDDRRTTKLVHVTPLAYLGLLGGVIPFVILAIVLRKEAVVELPICARHRRWRLVKILASTVGFIAGLAMTFFGALMNDGWTALAGLAVVFASLLYGAVAVPFVAPSRITNSYVVVRRCRAELLDGLPEVQMNTLP